MVEAARPERARGGRRSELAPAGSACREDGGWLPLRFLGRLSGHGLGKQSGSASKGVHLFVSSMEPVSPHLAR
jgi:hypothetical protein